MQVLAQVFTLVFARDLLKFYFTIPELAGPSLNAFFQLPWILAEYWQDLFPYTW